jgi:hypothetical protein
MSAPLCTEIFRQQTYRALHVHQKMIHVSRIPPREARRRCTGGQAGRWTLGWLAGWLAGWLLGRAGWGGVGWRAGLHFVS